MTVTMVADNTVCQKTPVHLFDPVFFAWYFIYSCAAGITGVLNFLENIYQFKNKMVEKNFKVMYNYHI